MSRALSGIGPLVVHRDDNFILRFISSLPKNTVYRIPAATAPMIGPAQ